MTPPDPTFDSIGALEAWTTRTAREAKAHDALGERTATLDALKIIRRVRLAHQHLYDRENDDGHEVPSWCRTNLDS